MSKIKFLTLNLALTLLFSQSAWAAKCGIGNNFTEMIPAPGYKQVLAEDGICIYKNGYETVFLADIKAGAFIDFIPSKRLYERYLNNQKKEVIYQRASIDSFFKNADAKKLKAVVNSQFFGDYSTNKVYLSLTTKKVGGTIFSKGPDMRLGSLDKTSDFRTIEFLPNKRVKVRQYSLSDVNSNNQLIVGFEPYYSKKERNFRVNDYIGRTFAGVRNGDTTPLNGEYEFFIVVVSERASTEKMRNILYDWKVNQNHMVMFDGSGSSQYKYKGTRGDGCSIPLVFGFRGY